MIRETGCFATVKAAHRLCARLDLTNHASQTPPMHNSFLIFDFGADENAAQQARHKLDGWKQAFRLDKKLLYKFERQPGPETATAAKPAAEKAEPEKPSKAAKGKGKPAKPAPKDKPAASEPADGAAPPSSGIKLLVRLYFSGHEKLSYQRWADRIPTEEPFKSAKLQAVRPSDAPFAETDEKFEALE
jgi:hypothetical protein